MKLADQNQWFVKMNLTNKVFGNVLFIILPISKFLQSTKYRHISLIATLNLSLLVKNNQFYRLNSIPDDDSRAPLFLTEIAGT